MDARPRLAAPFPAFPDGADRPLRMAARGVERFVVVDGSGPLASSVATLLRATGAARVQAGAWAADTADAELRVVEPDGLGAFDRPDLVVLVAFGSLAPRRGEPWRRRGVPHLPVVVDAGRVVVGPWVGADPSQPCLDCLHLTRTGRDPAWLAVTRAPPVPPTVDGPLVAMGSGLAVMVAMAGLGSGAIPPGVSVEVGGPWPRVEHRRWDRHTDCPSHDRGEPGEAVPAAR
jgi:hypothetical protein